MHPRKGPHRSAALHVATLLVANLQFAWDLQHEQVDVSCQSADSGTSLVQVLQEMVTLGVDLHGGACDFAWEF